MRQINFYNSNAMFLLINDIALSSNFKLMRIFLIYFKYSFELDHEIKIFTTKLTKKSYISFKIVAE